MSGRTISFLSLILMLCFGMNTALADGVWEGQIADDNDDVEQQGSSMSMGSSDLEMISDGNTQVGIRFVNVAVPPGSAISNAYIEFHVDQIDPDQPVNLIIQGELSPDAAAFASTANNLSDRPTTTAQVQWSPEFWPTVDETHQTVDISSIIEEIVSQPGWQSGNALVLIIFDDPDNPASGFRTARAGPGDDSSLLHIEFGPAVKAKIPNPGYGQTDVLRDSDLGWASGAFAATHDVYFGTDFDDVDNASRADPMDVLVSQGQAAATLDLDRLEFGQTYYWRIDEVNGAPDNTVFKGDIWNFTVEPFVYPVENIIAIAFASDPGSGPERTIDGSGLDANDGHSVEATDMWLGILTGADVPWVQYEFDSVYKLHEILVWNYNVQFEVMLGFGFKDVTVEYSANGADWTVLGDIEFAKAPSAAGYTPSTTIDFGGVPVKYVRLTANSNWGGLPQYGLSEVRFLYVPAHARNPQPADGQMGVAVGTTLDWRAGREAAAHEVYVSANGEDVVNGTALVDTIIANSFAGADLEFGLDYFWKIVEVNEAEAISAWEGNVWRFRTEEYALIDGFESYNDDEGSRIYEAWVDGYGTPANGSQVGYLESPFAEGSTVNSGSQSMPLFYDNTGAANVSEAVMDLGGMNLSGNGADSLRLYVSGSAPAFLESADGTILMNGTGHDIWDNADEFRFAYKQLTGNGSMIARVDDLDGSSSGWAKAGVMIRQDDAVGSVHAFMAMTGGDGEGYSFQRRLEANGTSTGDNGAAPALAPPYWVKIERVGDVFTASMSPDGVEWTEWGTAQTIAMTDSVLIGLALTSHNDNQDTSAAFSNVSFTGASGAWQIAEIGKAQPTGNDPQSIYVALGNSIVTHPDAALTARSGWTEWVIPLSEFGNVSNVQSITVGIEGPGSGQIFVDDIGYGRAYTGPADITAPGDIVQGLPNDGDWPGAETPDLAIDDDVNTKFLHFKGETEPTGFQVTPSVGATVVTGLTFATANDAPERDPIAFELYGSKDSIDGPYTLIASGDIADFNQGTAWERFTMNSMMISFENLVAYDHYQVLFPTVRDAGSANSMQIAEVELIGLGVQ